MSRRDSKKFSSDPIHQAIEPEAESLVEAAGKMEMKIDEERFNLIAQIRRTSDVPLATLLDLQTQELRGTVKQSEKGHKSPDLSIAKHFKLSDDLKERSTIGQIPSHVAGILNANTKLMLHLIKLAKSFRQR